MAKLILSSFSRGEVGPSVYARVDHEMYKIALRTARNVEIHSAGGVSNRAGTIFIGPCKTHTSIPRLFSFHYRVDDQYTLEMGDLYMRVIRNDGHVLNSSTNITAATKASPVVITASGHGFSNGEEIFVTGVLGMTELNGNRYIVAGVAGTSFNLTEQADGSNVDGTGFTTYTSAGTIAEVFELTTPYTQADLAELKMVQSGDVMTITHPSYAPRDLTRSGHNSWALAVNTYAPSQGDPTGVTLSSNGVDNSVTYRYKVTVIAEDTLEESLPGVNNASGTIEGITKANPASVNDPTHGLITGDEIEITGIVGMTELNGRRFIVTRTDGDNYTLDDENSSNYTAWSSGGVTRTVFIEITNGTTIPDNTIAWTAVSGAKRYAVYRRDNGIYGLVGETELLTYTEDNAATVAPNLTISPPRARNPFYLAADFPRGSGYFEQRQVYGGTTDNPDRSFYSRTASRLNMSKSLPLQADDAITADLVANDVNEIRHFVTLDDLLIMTNAGEWRVNSGPDSGLSSDTIKQKPQSTWGCSHIKPIIAGKVILFVEDGGARVRSLGFSLEDEGYSGNDLNALADHLLAEDSASDYIITDTSFSRFPEPRMHAIRSDGTALTMTFSKEQGTVAWTTWDTRGGKFKQTSSLRRAVSSVEDATFFVVERLINSNTVLYIERLASRKFSDVRDCFFVDSGLSYDTPLMITAATAADPVVVTTLAAHGLSNGDQVDISDIVWVSDFDSVDNETQPDQLNDRRYLIADKASSSFALCVDHNAKPITGTTKASPVVVTAVGHGFANGDVVGIFGVVGMTELNGITYTVANKNDDDFELTGVNGTGFTAYTSGGTINHVEDGSSFNAYLEGGNARLTATIFTGAEHLEGETVVALADGNVIKDVTISAGSFTLSRAASRVHMGKQIISDIQLLDIETERGTIQGALTKIPSVVIRFKKSRGLLYGPDIDNLVDIKQREFEALSTPTDLLTGDARVILPPIWKSNGRIFFRQRDPLPLTILGVIPDIFVEDEE